MAELVEPFGLSNGSPIYTGTAYPVIYANTASSSWFEGLNISSYDQGNQSDLFVSDESAGISIQKSSFCVETANLDFTSIALLYRSIGGGFLEYA